MLISFIRRHMKLLFIIILSLMVVPFLFWGIGSIGRQAGEKREPLRVKGRAVSFAKLREAWLDSQIILLAEFIEGNNIKTPEQFESYKEWFNKMVSQADLNRIAVSHIILQDEARLYGINVEEDDVRNWIENFPLFQTNGVFDIDRYNNLVGSYLHTWPSMFEKALRRVLTVKKLQRFIMDQVLVSKDEAYLEYKKRNEKVEVYYVEFNPLDYIKDVGPVEEGELKDYYERNREDFREPEKIKIAYLLFSPAQYRGEVTILDKEIEDYYKVGKYDKPLEEVKKEIIEILTTQKSAELCQEEALKASIQLTAEKRISDMMKLGGVKETEYLSKEQQFIPGIGWAPEVLKIAWGMELGYISDLIHVGDKWVIISPKEKKESRIPGFDEVKDRVRDILKNKKAEEIAKKSAEEVLNKLPGGMPFTMAVRSLGLKPKKSKPITRENGLFALKRGIVKDSTLVCPRRFYPIDNKEWEEERERFTKAYLEEKKYRFYQTWLAKLLSQ